jgi:hypothetical protein
LLSTISPNGDDVDWPEGSIGSGLLTNRPGEMTLDVAGSSGQWP